MISYILLLEAAHLLELLKISITKDEYELTSNLGQAISHNVMARPLMELMGKSVCSKKSILVRKRCGKEARPGALRL